MPRNYRYHLFAILVSNIIFISHTQNDHLLHENINDVCKNCTCGSKDDNEPIEYFLLDCTWRTLDRIPDYSNVLTVIEETRLDMSFSHNNITYLNQLPATNAVVFFSCRHCGISKISTAAFVGVPNIFKIDLSWNELKNDIMRADIFRGQHNDLLYEPIGLVELDLSYNLLDILEYDLFEHLPGLRILKLTHNPLNFGHASTVGALASLKYIEKLDLAYTGIDTLPEEILNGRLIELNIFGNKFATVPDSLALSRTKLRLLNIGGNVIKEFNETSLKGLSFLKHLHMSDMESLEKIHFSAFTPLISLESLYCFNNSNITSINIGSLNKDLRILDISNCSLRTMEFKTSNNSDEIENDVNATSIKYLKLKSLKIDKNVWNCDCIFLKSLKNLMQFSENDFRSENTARCSTPYDLTSDFLIDISIDTLCFAVNNKKPRQPVYDPPAFLRPRSLLHSLLFILIVVLIGLCIGFSIVLIKKKLQNEIRFSSPIRYTTVRNSTISVVN